MPSTSTSPGGAGDLDLASGPAGNQFANGIYQGGRPIGCDCRARDFNQIGRGQVTSCLVTDSPFSLTVVPPM